MSASTCTACVGVGAACQRPAPPLCARKHVRAWASHPTAPHSLGAPPPCRPACPPAGKPLHPAAVEVTGPASPVSLLLTHTADAAARVLTLHCCVINRTLHELKGLEVRGGRL